MNGIGPSGFGPYELLAKLGEAARGPVFLARRSGDLVGEALFLIESAAFATGEDEPLRRFLQDVERAAQLRHRNVMTIVDLATNATAPYVVMQYVEACSLAELQERHRAIRPPRLVVTAIIDALQGLHAAHTLPLQHGCLSPDHLMIGIDGICRLTGFGHARPRVQTKPSLRTRMTTGYMAPEQLRAGERDHRADLFAIGVVLWNALTGKRLFHDRAEHMTMSNVLERKVPRPSTIGLSPPPVFDNIVLKALERDPAQRFQTAAELASALRDTARASGCLAQPSELGEWLTTTFGGELAARRRLIRELSTRVQIALPLAARDQTDVVTLPRLGGPPSGDAGARDELSIDELSRANEPLRLALPPDGATGAGRVRPPRPSRELPVETASLDSVPTPYAEPPARRQVAIVAVIAFAVVASVLGWRWAVIAAPNADAAGPVPHAEVQVTVLEVRSAKPPPPPKPTPPPAPPADAEPPADAPEPSPGVAKPATPDTTTGAAPAVRAEPSRAPVRGKRQTAAPPPPPPPTRPTPPARTAPATTRPAEVRTEEQRPDPAPSSPRADTPPPKPDSPPKPTLESNPYLYK